VLQRFAAESFFSGPGLCASSHVRPSDALCASLAAPSSERDESTPELPEALCGERVPVSGYQFHFPGAVLVHPPEQSPPHCGHT